MSVRNCWKCLWHEIINHIQRSKAIGPLLLTLARACAAKGYCSRSVGLSVCRSVCLSVCVCICSHVFSRTVAAVDTKRGYVGMCNGRSAQQESGAGLSKNSMFTAGT